MTIAQSLGVALLIYWGWAAVRSKGHLHIIWSTALLILLISVALLRCQAFSTTITVLLYLLTLVDLLLCMALSPLQGLFYSDVGGIPPDQDRIRIFPLKVSSSDSNTASTPVYVCEFVYPELRLYSRTDHTAPPQLVSLRFMASHQMQQQLGIHAIIKRMVKHPCGCVTSYQRIVSTLASWLSTTTRGGKQVRSASHCETTGMI